MVEPSDMFNELYDPFVPETVRVKLPNGTNTVDIGATALNYCESLLPQVDCTSLQEGDVLSVEFDNDHSETFTVDSVQPDSLVFGSETILHPIVSVQRTAHYKNEPTVAKLYGSAIFPSGSCTIPGTIRSGFYMTTDMGISAGTIRSFDIKRPDNTGNLHPVILNKQEAKTHSASYAAAVQNFNELSALLAEKGFSFSDIEQDVVLDDGFEIHGSARRYKNVNGNRLIYAVRQGFGSANIPQDEIWLYDAKAEILRAIRAIPTKGIMQLAVAEGVTKDMFQKVGNGYKNGNTPDWREPFLDSVHIHWLSEEVPVTTYSWLKPEQEAPILTILEAGKNVSELLKTPLQVGETLTQEMKARGDEDLLEFVQQTTGINPNDESYAYDHLEVDIFPGKAPTPRRGSATTWTTEERALDALNALNAATRIAYTQVGAVLTVDKHNIHIHTDITKEYADMIMTAKRALRIFPTEISSRLLSRLRIKN